MERYGKRELLIMLTVEQQEVSNDDKDDHEGLGSCEI